MTQINEECQASGGNHHAPSDCEGCALLRFLAMFKNGPDGPRRVFRDWLYLVAYAGQWGVTPGSALVVNLGAHGGTAYGNDPQRSADDLLTVCEKLEWIKRTKVDFNGRGGASLRAFQGLSGGVTYPCSYGWVEGAKVADLREILQ